MKHIVIIITSLVMIIISCDQEGKFSENSQGSPGADVTVVSEDAQAKKPDDINTDPTGDDPGADDPTGDDPAVDDPTGDDPVVDDPPADNPASDDPADKDPEGDDPEGDDPEGNETGDDEENGPQKAVDCDNLESEDTVVLKLSGNREARTVTSGQVIIAKQTGNQPVLDINFSTAEEGVSIKGICLFLAGNQATTNINLAVPLGTLSIKARGNKSTINITTAEGAEISNTSFDLKGNKPRVLLNGEAYPGT